MKSRVVITGLGVVSCLGSSVKSFWEGLCSGRSGISRVSSFDTALYRKHFGGEVRDFCPEAVLSEAEARVFGRASQMTIAAGAQALKDARIGVGCATSQSMGPRVGVIMGTTFGESQILEGANEWLHKQLDGAASELTKPRHLGQYSPNALSANVARKFALFGSNIVVPTACSAGNYAVALGVMLIRMCHVDVVLAGGADPFSRVAFAGFSRLGVMAEDRCQPFDRFRRGMLVSEGAGVVVMERYEAARARGASIYAEVLGYGLSCDAKHMTIPSADGMTAAIAGALEDSNIQPQDIDYVCAHGTGTATNDRTECQAIRKVFYERGHEVPVSSIKSMLGHAMGAASALETIASVLAIKDGRIPPTMNFEVPDPECEVDCVPNQVRLAQVDFVLNNSFAFGGNNACVVLGKVP